MKAKTKETQSSSNQSTRYLQYTTDTEGVIQLNCFLYVFFAPLLLPIAMKAKLSHQAEITATLKESN